MTQQHLLFECDDQPGLVHGVTGVLFRHHCNVTSNHEFVDHESARFFMRTEFTGAVDAAEIEAETRAILPPAAIVRMSMLAPRRVVVLCSREHHCVADLLTRHAFGELNASVKFVLGLGCVNVLNVGFGKAESIDDFAARVRKVSRV